MPDRYCPACGEEFDDDPRYCPECGVAVGDDQEPDTINGEISTDGDSWDWNDPSGPFRSPRRALGTLNGVGVATMILAAITNAFGFPITLLPEPIPIVLFLFWFGVIIGGVPLWGLLHVTDNVLGFLRRG